jgi:hypothetical protein
MSYRNPTQVVDTQTGKAYADLQKTIAGSFGNYAKSYEAANIRRRKEEKENQKVEVARRNKILAEESQQQKSFGNISTTYPTINFDGGVKVIYALADLKMQETLSPSDNAKAASYSRVGAITKQSSINLLANSGDYSDAYKLQVGSYGGFDKNAPASEIKDNNNLYKLGSESLTYETVARYELNASNGLDIFYDVVKDGEKTVTHSGTSAFDYIIPNFQPYINKTIKENIGGFNYKDGNDPIYKGGKPYRDTSGKIIGVYPNKDVYKESIKQSVSANLLGGQSRLQATMLNNNIFNRNPDQSIQNEKNWIEFVDGDTSEEKKQQDLDKQAIVDNGVNFIANQAPALQAPYVYKQGESAEDSFNDINGGKDFYNEVKKNPIGMYQEYVGVKPIFNLEKNTITIGKESVSGYDEDNPELTKDVVYKMNDSTDRNRFYLNLLRASERTKGTSILSKNEQKGYEDALRNDTSFRSSKLDKKKKEAEAKAKEKADAKAKAEAEALEKEKNEAEVFKVDQKRGNQVTKRS